MQLGDIGMNNVIQLVQIIGTPFNNQKNTIALPKGDIHDLYLLAKKNKIGITFLNALSEQNLIEKYGLTEIFKDEKKKYVEQCKTVSRISTIFNNNGVDYAVFKSRLPFEATPNDTDIIHFGSKRNFDGIVNLMRNNGYIEICGYVDTQQKMFHDTILGGIVEPHPKNKDVYDVDIYQQVSASYLHYLTKEKISKSICKKNDNIIGSYLSLNDETELMTIIVHSIIPEIINTLFVYYATLNYISHMNNEQLDNFMTAIKENHVIYCVKVHLTVVATLHEKAHGFIPDKIKILIEACGFSKREYRRFVTNNYSMPFKYSEKTLLICIIEKMCELSFIPSLFHQCFKMIHPKMLYWVISELYIRTNRETY